MKLVATLIATMFATAAMAQTAAPAPAKKEEECEPDSPNIGKPTYQAEKALEILALYKWWTEVYPNRPDPHDASGWTAYCELNRLSNGGKMSFSADKTPALKKASKLALKELRKIEEAYEKEDEAMMIRLIKIRNSLWT